MNKQVILTVAQKSPPEVIHYVQMSNEIPIEFWLADYDITDTMECRLYIKKPSGSEVYNGAVNDGDHFTYYPTAQSFAESGRQMGQLQIVDGTGDDKKILMSFILLFDIEPNLVEESAIPSSNEFGILDQLIDDARDAIKDAQTATNAANTAAESANTAAQGANTAAGQATTAAGSANTAASAANSAKDAANTAAGAANSAASAANQAAQAANDAAEAVNDVIDKIPDIGNYPFYPYYGSGTDNTVTPGMGMLAEVAGGRATFTNDEATQIGYLRISLPEEPTKTQQVMIAFDALIASYSNGATGIYSIGGELYRSGTTEQDGWARQSAVFIGKHDTGIADLPVVFGMDPTTYRRYVQIGNVDTDWGYGCAVIKNVRSYWNMYGAENWKEGWSIEITTEPIPGTTISDDPTIIQPITAGGTGGATKQAAKKNLAAACVLNSNRTNLSINASAVTIVPLNSFILKTDEGFTLNDYKLTLPYDGFVSVSGCAYVLSESGGINYQPVGVFIDHHRGDTLVREYSAYGAGVGGVAAPTVVIEVEAGDEISLLARSYSTAGEIVPNNPTTFLSATYV